MFSKRVETESETATVFLFTVMKCRFEEEDLKIRWSVYIYLRSRLLTYRLSGLQIFFASTTVKAEDVVKT